MRPAVEDDTAVETEDVREARRLPALVGTRSALRLGPRAQAALEQRSEALVPSLGVDDPGSKLERRLVAHVPLVAALELGDPVADVILVETDDRSLHPPRIGRPHRTQSWLSRAPNTR